MNHPFVRQHTILRQGLIVDPEGKHRKRIGQAVWVYLYLLLAVNPGTGRRILSPEHVARDLGASEATVRSWLGHLRKHGYVALDREGRHLRVTVARWPREAQESKKRPVGPDQPQVRPQARMTSQSLARALECPSEEPILKEILARYDPKRVQEALDKVTKIPKSRIRKSRLALFRYLLDHPENH